MHMITKIYPCYRLILFGLALLPRLQLLVLRIASLVTLGVG